MLLNSNSVGCDSTATLDLTINYSNSGSESVTVCDSYIWNSDTLLLSGTYIDTLTNISGCDSIATLFLTINSSSFSNTIASACEIL